MKAKSANREIGVPRGKQSKRGPSTALRARERRGKSEGARNFAQDDDAVSGARIGRGELLGSGGNQQPCDCATRERQTGADEHFDSESKDKRMGNRLADRHYRVGVYAGG